MSDRVSEFSIFSEDDYGPIGNGKQTGSSKYPITLNTNDLGSYEISNLGPCMNPKGYVSNTNCPKDNPLCNCPPESKPKKVEPTDAGLLALKANTNECYLIKTYLSSKWFGIDYSNPKCSYNCFEETSDSTSEGSTSGSGLTAIQKSTIGGTTPSRKAFGQGATQGKTGSFWTVPGDVIGQTLDDDIVITGSTAGGSTAGGSTAINNFKHYLEYSKTNATFWYTPKETPLYRKAQTALLTYQRIKIVVNGDFSIKPGNLVAINMPTPEMLNIDETRFHGTWMVYRNEHIITSQKHSMILYLMRDGNYHNPNREFNINIEKKV
jgi:hypothetical protein